MTQPTRAVRSIGAVVWHAEPGCPDFPRGEETEAVGQLPPDAMLCAWCASRGSGSQELDDLAADVLRHLRTHQRLDAVQVRAASVSWRFGDAFFHFQGPRPLPTKRISRATLEQSRPVALADSLCRHLLRDVRTP